MHVAKNFNVEKAVDMFRKVNIYYHAVLLSSCHMKHLVWRKEYDVDSVSQWTPPEVYND